MSWERTANKQRGKRNKEKEIHYKEGGENRRGKRLREKEKPPR